MPAQSASPHGAALAKGALLSAAALAASNLRGVFTLLIARLLGETALGVFGVAWAAMDLASKFGTLGLDYRLTALLAGSEAHGDRRTSRLLLRRALTISLVAALVVTGAGIGAAALAARASLVAPPLAWATATLCLALPGLVVYRVANAASRGLKVVQHDILSRGLADNVVATIALVALVTAGVGPLAPELAGVAGALCAGVVAWRLAERLYAPTREPATLATARPPSLLGDAWPVAVHDFLNILIMRLDVIVLGAFADRVPGVTLQTVGIYAACVEIAGGLRKISQVFTPILMPVLAEHLSTNRRREAEESYAYVARWMLALLLPAVAVLTLSGGAILALFGPSFRVGAPWLAIAGAACALNAFAGIGATVLMIVRPRWNAVNTAIACVAAVWLNLELVPRFGPLGAALAMLGPYAIQGVLRAVALGRLLGWRLPWRTLLRPWGAAVLPLPLAMIVWMQGTGIGVEIATGLVYLTGYVASWAILGLDPADRAVIDRLRRRAPAEVEPAAVEPAVR